MTYNIGSLSQTELQDALCIERERQAAVMEERARLAREIHDTLAQAFIGIAIQIEAAEEVLCSDIEQAQRHLARARKLALASVAEARRTVQGLRSPALDSSDLATALDQYVQQIVEGTGASAIFMVEGERCPLPPGVEAELLRVGQEALTNIIKHAQATRIEVRLTFTPEELQLCVEDNGRGFPAVPNLNARAYGLLGMRERIERIHGQIEFRSVQSQGTQVVVTVPIPTQASTTLPESSSPAIWEPMPSINSNFDHILRGRE